MEITKHPVDGAYVLGLLGHLNLEGGQVLKQDAQNLLEKGICILLIDMSQVEFVNSAGLGALVELVKTTRKFGGRLLICGLAPQVRVIFEITQLINVFEIFKTKEEALASGWAIA